MAPSHFPDRRDHASASVRNLKLLLLVLLVSNVGLGLLSFFLLRSVDQRYTELLARTVPLLNDLQTLTAKSVNAMRGTNPDGVERVLGDPAKLSRFYGVVGDERALREKILSRPWPADLVSGRNEIERAGVQFTQRCLETLDLQGKGERAASLRIRDERLKPAFEDYLNTLTKASDLVEADSDKVSEQFSGTTVSFSRIVLGVGIWPVIAVGALLVLTAVFLGVLMLAFRGKDLSEAP
jgi:hypothetical protein